MTRVSVFNDHPTKDSVAVRVAVERFYSAFRIFSSELYMDFRPAKLIIPASTSADRRWYICFYIYNAQLGKMVRKRIFDLPSAENEQQRKYRALQLCAEINRLLASGHVIDPVRHVEASVALENKANPLIQRMSVSAVLNRILELKNFTELRTQQTYNSIVKQFVQYLNLNDLDMPIEEFTREQVEAFLLYQRNKGNSLRTSNNFLLTFRSLWQEAIDLNFTDKNPWKEIKKSKTPLGKNIAYLPHQQKEILDFAQQFPEIEFLIKFMYYTLARTNEIAQLQIKHIGMYLHNKIYLEAGISKNDHERHIIIPPGLEKELTKRSIRNYPAEWYIFSRAGLAPGPNKQISSKLGEKYRQQILTPLKYPLEYTLYSWKHTGVIAAHKAGVSDDDIMKQTGHKDYGSFQKYLKSLGLFDNQEFASKIPEI